MATTGKFKQDKHCASEINSARSKLDGVLQTLVTKSEDSPDVSENDSVKTSPEIPTVEVSPSVVNIKKSLIGKPPRKRRRKDDAGSSDQNNFHHTFVMKLFDRSVDLAQFSEDAPLYPICRSWMYNQPQRRVISKSRSPSPEPESNQNIIGLDESQEECKSRDVYFLPPPLPPTTHSDGDTKDHRIPSPIPPNLNPTDPEAIPSREVLINNHVARWKLIRQKWKEAALLNESRFKESLLLIKSLFER